MKMPPVQYDLIRLTGGMDIVTPTLSLPPGFARDCINFEAAQRGGFDPMVEHKRTILLVRDGPFLVGGMQFAKVHQGDRVIRIENGRVKALELEPTNPAMVVLDEFAVDFAALLFAQYKFVPLLLSFLFHELQIGWFSTRPPPVGTTFRLQLQ